MALSGIDQKLKRAEVHIGNLEREVTRFCNLKPYSVRVQEGTDQATGRRIGRLIATRTPGVLDPNAEWVLLAGEAIYQLRSALDHLICQLVVLNGQSSKVANSRRHQFPIFEVAQRYAHKAGRMIDGVSHAVADMIAKEQPYARSPHAPRSDPLWILQDLNNTDKHRSIPVSVIGIGEVRGYDSRGKLFILTSPDIVLKDGKIFWSFSAPNGRYDDIHADIACSIAFKQAMSTVIGGPTASMHSILWDIYYRVHVLIDLFRPLF